MALLFKHNGVIKHKKDALSAVRDFYHEQSVDTTVLETTMLLPCQAPWHMTSIQYFDKNVLVDLSFQEPQAWTRSLIVGYDDEAISKRLPKNKNLICLRGDVLVWRQFTKQEDEHAEAKEPSLTLDDKEEIMSMINERIKPAHDKICRWVALAVQRK